MIQQLLPIPRAEADGTDGAAQAEYIYEQPIQEIFGKLLPKQVETQIYRGMIESVASEQVLANDRWTRRPRMRAS